MPGLKASRGMQFDAAGDVQDMKGGFSVKRLAHYLEKFFERLGNNSMYE
jgi:hypothetical protein